MKSAATTSATWRARFALDDKTVRVARGGDQVIAFLLVAQIAGATGGASAPTFVIIRDGPSTTSVPVTINNGEPSVRADALMRAMKGMLITGKIGRASCRERVSSVV